MGLETPTVFNEYGVPDQTVSEAEDLIATVARRIFVEMVDKGYPPTELRAVAQYLESGIGVACCEELLMYQMKLHKAKKGAGV